VAFLSLKNPKGDFFFERKRPPHLKYPRKRTHARTHTPPLASCFSSYHETSTPHDEHSYSVSVSPPARRRRRRRRRTRGLWWCLFLPPGKTNTTEKGKTHHRLIKVVVVVRRETHAQNRTVRVGADHHEVRFYYSAPLCRRRRSAWGGKVVVWVSLFSRIFFSPILLRT